MVGRGLGSGAALPPDRYNTPIEDLNLSVRAYNCLKRSGLMTVGTVLEKSEEELLALRNFGRKSYDELRDKLVSMNFLAPGEIDEGMRFAAAAPGHHAHRRRPSRRRRRRGAGPGGQGAAGSAEGVRQPGPPAPHDDDDEDEDEE